MGGLAGPRQKQSNGGLRSNGVARGRPGRCDTITIITINTSVTNPSIIIPVTRSESELTVPPGQVEELQ